MVASVSAQWFLVGLLLLAGPTPSTRDALREVDALAASPDHFRLLLENEEVRVLEYQLLPGERDHWHTHPPKVSFVVAGGRLRITTDDGKSFDVDETTDSAAWMGTLGWHFAENIGTTTVRIVLIEVKRAAPAATSPR